MTRLEKLQELQDGATKLSLEELNAAAGGDVYHVQVVVEPVYAADSHAIESEQKFESFDLVSEEGIGLMTGTVPGLLAYFKKGAKVAPASESTLLSKSASAKLDSPHASVDECEFVVADAAALDAWLTNVRKRPT